MKGDARSVDNGSCIDDGAGICSIISHVGFVSYTAFRHGALWFVHQILISGRGASTISGYCVTYCLLVGEWDTNP